MKKLLSLGVAVLAIVVLLTGCGEKNVEGNLPDIMEKIYEKMYAEVPEEERPMLETINTLTSIPEDSETYEEDFKSNIEYTIGTSDIKYKEIYESRPNISSIAYSVVLVRMEENADIEDAKKAIKENINPRKWGCVQVAEEDVIVKSKGDLIILIMVENATLRKKIETGFDNL